jgi:hypothetical protein
LRAQGYAVPKLQQSKTIRVAATFWPTEYHDCLTDEVAPISVDLMGEIGAIALFGEKSV